MIEFWLFVNLTYPFILYWSYNFLLTVNTYFFLLICYYNRHISSKFFFPFLLWRKSKNQLYTFSFFISITLKLQFLLLRSFFFYLSYNQWFWAQFPHFSYTLTISIINSFFCALFWFPQRNNSFTTRALKKHKGTFWKCWKEMSIQFLQNEEKYQIIIQIKDQNQNTWLQNINCKPHRNIWYFKGSLKYQRNENKYLNRRMGKTRFFQICGR